MNGLQVKTNEVTAGFTRKYGVIKKQMKVTESQNEWLAGKN